MPPSPNPPPLKGARATTDKPSPCGRGLGEGLVFLKKEPPTPATPVLPPEGEDQRYENLPPLGEVARSGIGGLVFLTRSKNAPYFPLWLAR